ncbi:MAG: urease accessory protein UreE [Pseudomonadota bacterium]
MIQDYGIARALGHADVVDWVTLGYADRLLRRKRLTTDGGGSVMVDLAKVSDLKPGMALISDHGAIGIRAADESILEITGDIARLAWHIGNRHTPCEIYPDRLRIAPDKVLADMVRHLGGTVTELVAPFQPEGGAYGHGRTMGHSHD